MAGEHFPPVFDTSWQTDPAVFIVRSAWRQHTSFPGQSDFCTQPKRADVAVRHDWELGRHAATVVAVSMQQTFDLRSQPLFPRHRGLPEPSNFTFVGTFPPSESHVAAVPESTCPLLLPLPELDPEVELDVDDPLLEPPELDESSPGNIPPELLLPHAETAHATAATVRVSVHVIRNVNMNPPKAPPRELGSLPRIGPPCRS